MTASVLAWGALYGFMVVVAGVLTLLSRRFAEDSPPATRRRRMRPLRLRRRAVIPPEPGWASGDGAHKALRARRSHGPVTTRRPVERVAADLRRLARELATVPAGAPFVRWQALQAAFDRVLSEAAELLEVPHAMADLPMGAARDVERLRVVCMLEASGLVVQD